MKMYTVLFLSALICSLMNISFAKIPEKKTLDIPCSPQVSLVLDDWNSTNEWRQRYKDDKVVYQAPTRQLGAWIEIEKLNEKETLLKRATAFNKTVAYFKMPYCKAEIKDFKEQKSAQLEDYDFSDGQLVRLVTGGKNGLIYIWSPKNHDSFVGLQNIERAAKKKNLKLTVLLDPKATNKEVEKYRALLEGENSYFRKANSFELKMLGALSHYPSIVGHKNGAIVREVFYGGQTVANYLNTIDAILSN